MARTSTWKLTLTITVTLAFLGIMIGWTALQFQRTSSGWSRLAFESLRARSEPVWAEAIATYRQQAPDPLTPLPAGDPLPSLEALMRNPRIMSAFYVDPTMRLTLLERSWGPGTEARIAGPIRLDLNEWEPQVLKLSWREQQRQRKLRQFDWELHRRELLLDAIVSGIRYSGLPAVRFTRNAGLSRNFGDPDYYVKGRVSDGFLGYVLDTVAITRQEALIEHHLADQVSWYADGLPASEEDIFPRFEVPAELDFLRLRPNATALLQLEAELEMIYWSGMAALGIGLVFGALAFTRQLRGLLAERSLMLAQSNFVSAVSHEMRTPLTTIKMYSDMLDHGIVTEPEKRSMYLQTISQECDRLTRLVENVLDYARISGKRRAYHVETLDTQDLVAEALASMRASLEAAGMAVEIAVPSLSLDGDRDALVQALINLLSNALKYARDGGRVRIFAEERDGTVTLGVEDWGGGIPLKEQSKVFQAFYRVGAELTRTAPGTGLGLALVEAYAKAHGGSVQLSSEPGQGSTFRIVLPQSRRTA